MERLFVIVLLVLLSGCAELSERHASSSARHPCGNIWDICRGDSQVLDKIRDITEGVN